MPHQIQNAIVSFLVIGPMTPARLQTRACQVTFRGGLIAEVEVEENQISSALPVRKFVFIVPGWQLGNMTGIQTLLADYSGPLTISELSPGGSVIQTDRAGVVATLYLDVPTVDVQSQTNPCRAEITLLGETFSSPAKVLPHLVGGCNVRIDESEAISLPLLKALSDGEKCVIELR